ncbi:MAG: hypothetical protein Q8R57_11320 [Bacteroidota bacterium]|nr:hypothetical protein [Bacteroidota bacterium]
MKDLIGISLMLLPIILFMTGLLVFFKRKEKLSVNIFKLEKVNFFIILILRWYIGYYMIDYGASKLLGEQFGGINENILKKPLIDVDKFYLTWYLFSLSPAINFFIGFLQIVGGVLLVINRTVIFGLIILVPIIIGILIVDLSCSFNMFGFALIIRVLMMLISCFVILYNYKSIIMAALKKILVYSNDLPNINWHIYLFLPLIGLLTDLVLAAFTYPLRYLLEYILR